MFQIVYSWTEFRAGITLSGDSAVQGLGLRYLRFTVWGSGVVGSISSKVCPKLHRACQLHLLEDYSRCCLVPVNGAWVSQPATGPYNTTPVETRYINTKGKVLSRFSKRTLAGTFAAGPGAN